MDSIDSSEGVHKGQLEAEENTSFPEEEDARLQSDEEVLFKWVAQGWSNTTRHDLGIHQDVPQVITVPETSPSNRAVASAELCDHLKEEYDVAKAVKADDVAVSVHLWDKAVCRGPLSPDEKKGLTIMRDLLLRKYRLHLWRDARQFLCQTYGNTWSSKIHVLKSEAKEDADAIQDILWQATDNNWFKLPRGSRLIFFCFPKR